MRPLNEHLDKPQGTILASLRGIKAPLKLTTEFRMQACVCRPLMGLSLK